MTEAPAGRLGRRRFLIVRCGELRCALDLASVRRVRRNLPIFPVPGAKPELLGLSQWRGEPLAIVDLVCLLGEGRSEAGSASVTIIVRVGENDDNELLGLAVEEALDVVRIPQDKVSGSGKGPVAGEAAVGPDVVRVLDLTALGAR